MQIMNVQREETVEEEKKWGEQKEKNRDRKAHDI